MPTRLFVESTTNEGVVEPEGCTWKAAVELVVFLKSTAPPSAKVAIFVPPSAIFNTFPVLVPLFTVNATPVPPFAVTVVTPPSATVSTLVPLSCRTRTLPVLVPFTLSAVAAPPCTMLTAVAAVPLVPLTVRPTTLFVVGVIVLAAVEVGTCMR